MATLFTNARITTMSPIRPHAAAMLVQNGNIERLLDSRPTGLAKDVEIVDLQNAAVYPGFHDCHAHLADAGLLAGDHDFGSCRNIDAMLRRIERLDDPILYAGNFEEQRIDERRPPNRKELDAVSPLRPVLLTRIDGHSCAVNSAALELLGVDGLEGVERDGEGIPTGRLSMLANYEAQHRLFAKLSRAALQSAALRAARSALAAGITTLHNVLVGDDSEDDLKAIYRASAELPLHVIPKSCSTNVQKVKKLGSRVFGGDIFVDGSIGSRTAALSSPYRDRPGQEGRLYLDRNQLFELFDEAVEARLSLGVHAIGDRAIDEAIAAWEKVVAKHGALKDIRPAIDHFEVTTPDHIERAGRCGLFLSTQPTFDYLWGGAHGMYEERLGDRARGMNRLKSALRAGCVLCGGSDSPVTKLDALLGMHAAVNHHEPDERLTIEEALRAYTSDAAKLAFEEGTRGTLAAGMRADFVAIEQPLESMEPSRIKDARVIATVVGGAIQFRAESVA